MKIFKAQIKITLRNGILDVQGKAVEHALHSIELPMLSDIRIGKFVELSVEAQDADTAKKLVISASEKLIANPIIEDYEVNIIDTQ